MKYISGIIAFITLLLIPVNSFAQCDSTLWNHVYNSYRLVVHEKCFKVTGTVYSLIYEEDGDIHIRLTVDTQFTYMLNSYNYSGEYGKLVCEPLCATTCTQPDAIASCANFTNTVYIPNVGEYVEVLGSYVTDNDHGWNEMHPVTKIAFPLATPNIAATKNPEVSVFPNPASSFITFRLSEKPLSPLYITILDEVGRLAGQYQLLETTELKVNTNYLPDGKYFYHMEQDNKYLSGGNFVIIK
jgi:hypothetical protein